MRVWLDDKRPMPAGFDRHVRTPAEAIALLEQGAATAISFDNDLGMWNYVEPNEGRHVAAAMEDLAREGKIPRIRCYVHTDDRGEAREAIKSSIRNAYRYWSEHERPG